MSRQQSADQMIKKAMQASSSSTHSSLYSFFAKDSRHLYCLLITSLSFFLFFVLFSFSSSSTSPLPLSSSSTFFAAAAALRQSPLPSPPSFAYFISGSANDADRLLRLVFAIYHPKNVYLLHIDLDAPQEQRVRLARDLHAVPVFRSGRNVHVLGSADFVNPKGSSALASTLHGAAVLLRLSNRWDWFVNLSADDYPLVTQDDLLHVFSFLPKDLNFVQHSSYIGWKESRRLKHVIVDPGLYLSSKADVFFATQKRDMPNAYRIFTGSSSVIISRKFIEHIVLGTDSLPRSLLMYFANTPSSHTNYLQTVLCNTPEFNRTIINDHLRYLRPESPPKEDQNRQILDNLTVSGAAFASGFSRDDPVLDMIDEHVLSRGPKRIVPGGWCLGRRLGYTDPCGVWGSPDALIPGTAAARLVTKVVKLLANESLQSRHCLWDGSM